MLPIERPKLGFGLTRIICLQRYLISEPEFDFLSTSGTF